MKALWEDDISSDEEEWICLAFLGNYRNSRTSEEWVHYVTCKKWVHVQCIKGELHYECLNYVLDTFHTF
jgi:sarcosine oxidase delta subunit